MTLPEFLLARIAEQREFLAMHLPGGINGTNAALADCEAKRRIVAAHSRPMILFGGVESWAFDLKYLAAVYADHPDYREEWRP